MSNNSFCTLMEYGICTIQPGLIPNCSLYSNGSKVLAQYAWGQAVFSIDVESGRYDDKMWDFRDGPSISIFNHYLSISPDDHYSVFCMKDNKIHSINLLTGDLFSYSDDEDRYDNNNGKIVFSNCSKMAAAVGKNKLNIFDVQSGEKICSKRVSIQNESKYSFHPSGKSLIYMNYETIASYEIPSFQKMWEFDIDDGGPAQSTWEFSHDGTMLVLCNYEDTVRVIDAYKGTRIASFRKGNGESLQDCHFSDDDKRVIVSSCDKTVRIWDLEKAKKLAQGMEYTPARDSYGEDTMVLIHSLRDHVENCVDAVIPYDNFGKAITVTKWDSTFYLWDIKNGQLLDKMKCNFSVDDFKLIQEIGGNKLIIVGKEDDHALNYDLRPNSNHAPEVKICIVLC